MIKLIATDIDGTLIEDSTPDLYPEIEEEIRRLTDQGVLFVCASGRQYYSICNVFREVSDRIIYIAENGAHIRYHNRDLSVTPMRRNYVEELIAQLRRYENCEIVVSTPEGSLVETKNQEFLDLMTYGYHNIFQIVEDVLAVKQPVLKVSIYRKGTIRQLGEEVLIPAWKNRLQVCVAGEEWVDFMDFSVDKGNALMTIQKEFGITRSETMAFGDNTNDVGLIKAAAESFAVENAHPAVKAAARYICPSWKEKGVWQIVQRVNKREDERDNSLVVSMFGGLKLLWRGEPVVLDKSSASKPMQLLQMLLHAEEQGVAREVLQEALYGNGKVSDRTNNLKQTVFRLRKMIEESILPPGQYIVIKKSRYYWSGQLAIDSDTAWFKKAIEQAEAEREEKQKLRYLMEACSLYQGEFLPRLSADSWAEEERSNYKKKYYESLREVCSILKQEGRYSEVLMLCKHAGKLYPHEEWDLECLDCLIALERFQEAQDFYRRTAAYYAEELHNNLSEELRERHALLSDRVRNTSGIIGDIQKDLCQEGQVIQGAYYCTYPNFEGICHQMARNKRGSEEHAALLLCTMLDSKRGIPLTDKKLQALSEKLHVAIQRNLRMSDCYTRYSENQFLILLVDCDLQNAGYAQKRIEYYLEREYGIKSGICYDAAVLK